jgi:ornithine cyclodeaminase
MVMTPVHYDAQSVRELLDYKNCIETVRVAMKSLSASTLIQPLRTAIEIAPGTLLGWMPGMLPSMEYFGSKVLSVVEEADRPGRSAHRGIVVLFNAKDGTVECIADAEEVTRVRTAAATAVATDVLARDNASRLTIFGSGVQAHSHILAIQHVRKLDEIVVWGRNKDVIETFVKEMKAETELPIRAEFDARSAASSADIICTVTGAKEPILFADWVRPGTHVNVVGSSRPGPVEIDNALVLASRYIADSRRSALAAAAEFLSAKSAGLIDDSHIVAEIGEVLLGHKPGRTDDNEITLYKSLGHVVQDLAAVAYIHSKAKSAVDPLNLSYA